MATTSTEIQIKVDTSQVNTATNALEGLAGSLDDVQSESRGAEAGLDGVAASADDVDSSGRGAKNSILELAAGMGLGKLAAEGLKEAFRFVVEATKEYVQGNEGAQEAVSELTESFGDFKRILGETIVDVGVHSGLIESLSDAFKALGEFMVENKDILMELGEAISGAVRFAIEGVLPVIIRLLELMDRLADTTQYLLTIDQQGGSNTSRTVIADSSALVEQQRQAREQRARGYMSPLAGRLFDASFVQDAATAGGSAGGGSAEDSDFGRALKEQEMYLQTKEDDMNAIRYNAMIESFNQTAAIEQERIALLESNAAIELEIERGKQEAMAQMQADTKARNMEQAALDREQAIADATAQGQKLGAALNVGLGALLENSGDTLAQKFKKLLGMQLKSLGMAAVAMGSVAIFADPYSGGAPNPAKGAALIGAGIAAQGLAAAFGAGGGGGRGSSRSFAAQPSTVSENRTFNVTNNIGMSTDPRATALEITRVTEVAERNGSRKRL